MAFRLPFPRRRRYLLTEAEKELALQTVYAVIVEWCLNSVVLKAHAEGVDPEVQEEVDKLVSTEISSYQGKTEVNRQCGKLGSLIKNYSFYVYRTVERRQLEEEETLLDFPYHSYNADRRREVRSVRSMGTMNILLRQALTKLTDENFAKQVF